ncbi:ankyrin [Piromyces finnis]|uniref:Ankyrin n=1 Tax=Piromyces finnis TaxID=1754191 RepID=A0A1Y1UVX5_9FUNG|nr:ankyrin [Piromyces finnis]|eukprot:ORX42185.1 ankyrin [Piromyces finnis]
MTHSIEDQRNNLIKVILKNNLADLRNYIKESNLRLEDLNDDSYDILISVIETKNDISLDIIQFIIDELPYKSLNYFIKNSNKQKGNHYSYGHYKTPLFSAIAYHKFKIATLLIKNKADINHTITDFKSLTGVAKNKINVVNNLYSTNNLSHKNLKYILDHGFKIQRIASAIIKDLITYKNSVKNDLLEIIFRYRIYDNDFILNFLHSYKYQKALSNRKLHYLITKEKNKIVVNDIMYSTTVQNAYYNNWDALSLFFVYDGSEPLKIFERIYQYKIFEKAIEKNDYYFIRTLLNYKPWKQNKNFDIEKLVIKAIRKNNVDITKLLLEFFFLIKNSSEHENYNFENILLEAGKKRSTDIILLLMDFIVKYKIRGLNQTLNFKEMIISIDLYNYIINEMKEDEQIIKNVKQCFKALSSPFSFNTDQYNKIENILFIACFYANENSLNLLKRKLNSLNGFDIIPDSMFSFENLLINNESYPPTLNKDKEEILVIIIESLINNMTKTTDSINNTIIKKWVVPYIAFLLNIAIKLESLRLVHYIIENEVLKPLIDLNAYYKNIENPMIIAYHQNNEVIFKYLLDHHASITIKNEKNTPLWEEALKTKNYKILREILKYSLPLDKNRLFHENSLSPLIEAIYHNDLYTVKSLVQESGYRLDVYSNTNIRINSKYLFTPLILSYLLQNKEIFKFLLNFVNINELDFYGYGILHYAILKEDFETIHYLIDHNVDVNYKENSAKYGHSAIDISIHLANKEIIDTLLISQKILFNIPNKDGELPISNIIKNPDFSLEEKKTIIKDIIKIGSYINFIDVNTPLKEAIQSHSIPLVELLLQHNANVNFIFNNGYSPLVYAIESKSLSMVQYLVEKGSDVNYVLQHKYSNNDNEIKETVILKAIESGDLSIFDYLLRQHAILRFDQKDENDRMIESVDKSGKTKIFEYLTQHYLDQFSNGGIIKSIIFHNQINLLKMVIDHGFNINTQDKNGDTPLGYAVKFSNEYLVDFLIHCGADINHINNKGESIYDISYKYSYRLHGQSIYKKIQKVICIK